MKTNDAFRWPNVAGHRVPDFPKGSWYCTFNPMKSKHCGGIHKIMQFATNKHLLSAFCLQTCFDAPASVRGALAIRTVFCSEFADCLYKYERLLYSLYNQTLLCFSSLSYK